MPQIRECFRRRALSLGLPSFYETDCDISHAEREAQRIAGEIVIAFRVSAKKFFQRFGGARTVAHSCFGFEKVAVEVVQCLLSRLVLVRCQLPHSEILT